MLRTHRFSLCVVSICLWHAAGVHAADRDEAARAGPERTWYGWQTLTVDAGALAILGVTQALAHDSTSSYPESARWAGLGTYVFGAPLVHAGHGNWGAAAASFSLRTLPVGSAYLMLSACDWWHGDRGCTSVLSAVTMVSFVLPLALDPALFAYETKRDTALASISPWFDRTGAGVSVLRGF